MQGTRIDRRKLITTVILVASVLLLVLVDQLTKKAFYNLNADKDIVRNHVVVIENFFYFTFVFNEGSAYGLLSGAEWAQTFFKIITPVAVLFFIFLAYHAIKNGYITFTVGIGLVISGTIGNFIDRVAMGKVIDFICLEIGGRRIFGVFNLADVFLSAGVVLLIVHFVFLDKNALFGKKENGKKDTTDDTAK